MPPASRGVLFLHLLRQYSQRAGQPSRLPATLINPTSQKSKPPSHLLPKDIFQSQSTRGETLQEPIFKPIDAQELPRSSRIIQLLRRIPLRFRRWLARALLIAPPMALIFLHLPIEIMWVNGPSMSPFLNPNNSSDLPQTRDRVLVQKFILPDRETIGLTSPHVHFQRGQIVVFYTPHDPEKIAVKRIVGVAGDRVSPLPGYSGGADPVVIPFNHLWVEGDVNDREKSIDSNWYGPISENLVIGMVKMVLNPWYSPSVVRWEQHKYSAKEMNRVEENVVSDAMIDPDTRASRRAFGEGGLAATDVETLKQQKDQMPELLRDQGYRVRVVRIYDRAQKEMARQDPHTVEVATELVNGLEEVFLAAGLTKTGQTRLMTPALKDSKSGSEPMGQEISPAKKALAQYLEKQKKVHAAEEAKLDLRDQQRRGLIVQTLPVSDDASYK